MIDEKSSIVDLPNLPFSIQANLLFQFEIIWDLIHVPVLELIKIKRINLFTIACLKKALNEYNLHLLGEEIVDYSDYFKEVKKDLLEQCDRMIIKRNNLHDLKKKTMNQVVEEISLNNEIEKILTQLKELSKREENPNVRSLKENV